MAATVAGTHGSGTHAARPAGNAVPDGSLYSCSDHKLIYVSSYAGNSWSTWGTFPDLAAHLADTTDAHMATAIGFTPAGTIAATDVQAAIEEVASEVGAVAHPTVTLGPYYINDLPGSATTQASLGY